MNLVIWHCHKCGAPIYRGETARVDKGNFYHIKCWQEKPNTDWYHMHMSQHAKEIK